MQVATFGRVLAGREDEMVGYERTRVQRGGKQLANVIRSVRQDSRVPGTVFEVTEAELLAADEYERGDDYQRIEAALASGIAAWVYVDAASLP